MWFRRIETMLREVLDIARRLENGEAHMAKELDDLTAEVAAAATVEASAVALLNGLAAQLAAAGTDPSKLTALHDSLKSSTDALAAAITANTPPTAPTP